MSARLEIADIKRVAQARVFDVLAGLGVPTGKVRGNYISMCNPMLKDRHPSFTVWIRGDAAGAWKDHRDDGPGGLRGDIIDLVSYLNGWWHQPKKGRAEACRWLRDRLALDRVSAAELARDRAQARRQAAAAEKRAAEELDRKRGRAFETWLHASADIYDTPVDVYLKSRGIDLRKLPRGIRGGDRVPHSIRYLAGHRHTESGRMLPVMCACCVSGRGEIMAIHRTFLKPDGGGKADIEPVKKVWPSFAGLVIPLWRGDTGLSVRQAIACGLRETLVLTEGIEDGLSAVMAAPQHRTWAFIALGNLARVVLPECIDGVVLHRQSEWGNKVAVAAFDRGKRALEAQGRPVVEVEAAIGKDLNDTLRSDVIGRQRQGG